MPLLQRDQKTKNFSELYNELYDLLYQSFLKIIKDEQTTKDILQEAFIKLWNNWDAIDRAIAIRPLVYTYAKNSFFDFLRKEKLRRLKETDNQKTVVLHTTVEDIFSAKETEKKISRAINKMPAAMRRVYVLSRQEDLKTGEIAEQLSISTFTVKRHLQNALSVLKRQIAENN